MAGEITALVSLKFSKNSNAAVQVQSGQQSITATGDHYNLTTQEIGTSAEALRKGEIGTPGMILVHNLDGTNFVEIGYDDTGFKPLVKVKPGEWQLFRLSQTTPQAKADTAACDLEFYMVED